MESTNKEINYFQNVKLGDHELSNRICMAALTRMRGTDALHGTANELMIEYYAQRASFGMILTECS